MITLLDLPNEILFEISFNLNIKDVHSLLCVNKRFYEFGKTKSWWLLYLNFKQPYKQRLIFEEASCKGKINIIDVLIKSKPSYYFDIHESGFMNGVRHNQYNTVKYFIKNCRGSIALNDHRYFSNPLSKCCHNNNIEIAKLLLENGAHVPNIFICNGQEDIITYTAQNGYYDLTELLLKYVRR